MAPTQPLDDSSAIVRRRAGVDDHHSRYPSGYPAASENERLSKLYEIISEVTTETQKSISNFMRTADPAAVAIVSATIATSVTLLGVASYRRWFRRLKNADSISSALLDRKPYVSGVVTRVGDGDGFRLYHTPGPFWRYPFKLRSVPTAAKDLKNQTLSIRIAGVDAPELAHFGNPAQPYGKEALEWLTATVEGKRLKCQLLRKDQYNRIVAVPWLPRTILPDKPLPLMMLRDGVAVVYTQGGSEYGPWGLDKMLAEEDAAKRARRGLWAAKKVELPGAYKKRVKEGGESDESAMSYLGKKLSLWERLGRWLGGKT